MVAKIAKIGLKRSPNEACGLILGTGTVVELENKTPGDKTCNWKFGSLESIVTRLEKVNLQAKLCESYIVWHTHPGGLIGPSSEDLSYRVKGVDYLVVTLTEDNPVGVRY